MERVWAIKQVTFNGSTYDKNTGGPLSWDHDPGINAFNDPTADQLIGPVMITGKRPTLQIAFRDPLTITPGTRGDVVLTLVHDDSATKVVTYPDMVFIGGRSGGTKGVPAEQSAVFMQEEPIA